MKTKTRKKFTENTDCYLCCDSPCVSKGDRVIFSTRGLQRYGEVWQDVIFTVDETTPHIRITASGAALEPMAKHEKTNKNMLPMFVNFAVVPADIVCEHDTHCKLCGIGQSDIGSGKPNAHDDMSWCATCSADICGNCDCGHDDWGA